jgi:hypothetical protein
MDKVNYLNIELDPKTMPVVVLMVVLVCALLATGALSVAVAQVQGRSLSEQNLAGGIVSDVLDGSDDEEEKNGGVDDKIDEDSTSTTTTYPDREKTVDKDNFVEYGDNIADFSTGQRNPNVTVPSTTMRTLDDRRHLENLVFCTESGLSRSILCFDTLEDCKRGEEMVASAISECEGFETAPPDALSCSVLKEGHSIRCELRS